VSRRILHIIDSLNRSGRAAQLLVLGQGLVKSGFDVHVAGLVGGRGPLAAELSAAGISTVEFNRRWPMDPVTVVRLQRLVARLRPDVVHTWDDRAAAYGRLVRRGQPVPQLLVGRYRVDPWKARWRWALERRAARQGERFAADSPAIRDWCLGHGLPLEKFGVIPPGVSTARASDVSRDELLRELRLPPEARLIGVVGRLVPEKRVKELIWAADLLRVLHDNLRMLVIGDGPLRAPLTQYARLASDLEHIRFLGERADTWRIMPHLDVLWNGSESRGHSIEILDAMAAGVPVVASDTPLNRELVVEGETGYLIPLGNRAGRAARARHTDRLFNDCKLVEHLASASRQRIAEHLSAPKMVQRHAEAYREIST
jgi:glycosyltransferase involved in cell wall biosynthesis